MSSPSGRRNREFALPNDLYLPSALMELRDAFFVPSSIGFDFLCPIGSVNCRQVTSMAFLVPVPEATVDENGGF